MLNKPYTITAAEAAAKDENWWKQNDVQLEYRRESLKVIKINPWYAGYVVSFKGARYLPAEVNGNALFIVTPKLSQE
jgi:hypothetical protein